MTAKEKLNEIEAKMLGIVSQCTRSEMLIEAAIMSGRLGTPVADAIKIAIRVFDQHQAVTPESA